MTIAADRARPPERAGFLDLLCGPDRQPFNCGRVVAVFAHPDDETIAMGGSLARCTGIRLLHVTDGAPPDGIDARLHGFAGPPAYALARRRELTAAAALAGIPPRALSGLGAADQTVARSMPALARKLGAFLADGEVDIVITHACEGGHPDHDATAFIVRAAALLLAGNARAAPLVIECPLYRSRDGEWAVQSFAEPAPPHFPVMLDGDSSRRKRKMLAAFATQRRTLEPFVGERPEWFREARPRDFAELPNGGDLLYERHDWGLDGEEWLRLSAAARAELGLPRWF